jgi:hypothetical protein
MTALRYHSSSPTERAFMTRKSWQHPGRRRHIHGPLLPPDPLVEFGRSIPSGKICVGIAVASALIFAASVAHHATGSTSVASYDAGRHDGGTR